ncbi:MAG TPA: GH25 family lysozyme, partial [Micromonosporaceae bacterium]|nr:GH25 family lysozyme [Micromonosporaceae bacterium]
MIFGWDTSHYDGHLTRAILSRAASEGIAFFSHKIGEGLSNTDPLAAEAFSNAKGLFQVIGGYYFIHHGQDMRSQARRCVSVADQVAPWWRDFNGWFWQTDAEAEQPYGLPTPSEVKAFSDDLAATTGRKVIVYASAGQYGDSLRGLGHPLWNAHYGSNPTGPFKSVYPGDHSPGWNAYSGQTPALLQYGSNTIIAGLSTCDANAYRGTIDDLLELIGGDVALTDADKAWITKTVNDAIAKVPRQVWSYDPNVTGQGGMNTPAWRPDAAGNPTAAPAWFVPYIADMVYALAQQVGIDLSKLPAVTPAPA